MDYPIPVRIFGVPTACETGVIDAWREVADWARERLTARFGRQLTVVILRSLLAGDGPFP